MKKFPLGFLLALVFALPALAQSGSSYRFDNFDVRAGVRVDALTTTASLPEAAHVRSTSSKVLSINNSNSRNKATLYTPPPAMIVGTSLNGFTTGDQKVDSYIVESGVRNRVDPVLLYAQMHTESSFKRGAISPKGARGLMQLMPFTARRFGVTNIFDPKQNIEGGARYMRFLLDKFEGDVRLALAGYNAGEGAVMKYGRRIPPYNETQNYVRQISHRYAQLRNGEVALSARSMAPAQVATLQKDQQPAVPAYERAVFAVKLPDGRIQLVSQ